MATCSEYARQLKALLRKERKEHHKCQAMIATAISFVEKQTRHFMALAHDGRKENHELQAIITTSLRDLQRHKEQHRERRRLRKLRKAKHMVREVLGYGS